jgi:hypothetical protein
VNLGNGGIALTYAAFTEGGNIIGGATNGQLSLEPKNGTPLLGYLLGAKYVAGPWTVGITDEEYWEQGAVQLTGISQRRARGISTGVSYAVAPAMSVYAEYQWVDQTQSGFNFSTGAAVFAVHGETDTAARLASFADGYPDKPRLGRDVTVIPTPDLSASTAMSPDECQTAMAAGGAHLAIGLE